MNKNKKRDLNIIGAKIGTYTVISFSHIENNRHACFFIKCDLCGDIRCVRGNDLRRILKGKRQEPVCLNCKKIERTKILQEKNTLKEKTPLKIYTKKNYPRLYYTWQNMKARCTRPTHKKYRDYGAREIYVCKQWLNNFEAFCIWSLEHGYKLNQGLSIDRINNDDGYCPENCRWTTVQVQNNNRRNSPAYN